MQDVVLRCDACHDEQEIEIITKAMIGLPCRVCGEPIVSRADFRAWQRLRFWSAVSRLLDRIFGPAAGRQRVYLRGGRLHFDDLDGST